MTGSARDLRRYGAFERPYISWIAAGFAQILILCYLSQGCDWAFPNLLGREPSTYEILAQGDGWLAWVMKFALPVLAGTHLVCLIGLVRNHDGWFGAQCAACIGLGLCFIVLAVLGSHLEPGVHSGTLVIETALAFNFPMLAAAAPSEHMNKVRVSEEASRTDG